MDYKCSDYIQFRAGQFKMPYELDELTSHEDLRMIDRGTTSALFVSIVCLHTNRVPCYSEHL